MNRRSFLTGLATSLIAAPAVVRAASLMPVRGIVMPVMPTLDWYVSRISHYLIYGNPEFAPTQFTGFEPEYGGATPMLESTDLRVTFRGIPITT